jgi:ubiquinone/menaquinone biosynthesis methyltransferase
MFDRIAPTYDRVNRAMTLGLDRGWRTTAVLRIPAGARSVLDLCAGTLDLAAEVLARRPAARVTAVDFSAAMLAAGRAKASDDVRLQIARADVARLPLRSGSFDAALCGFGVRNLPDRPAFLAEVRRVLATGGVLVVLDLFVPKSALAKVVHEMHTQAVVPVLGELLSGDPEAYRYLPDSVGRFVTRPAFEEELRAAGFGEVHSQDVGLGTVGIVRAS